jgi:uncharacterized protein YoaH (UPF0181 family)
MLMGKGIHRGKAINLLGARDLRVIKEGNEGSADLIACK